MYQDFLPVAIFIVLAIVLLVAPLAIQALVSPRFNKKGDKLEIYECGELPEGSAWVQFNIRLYIIICARFPHPLILLPQTQC